MTFEFTDDHEDEGARPEYCEGCGWPIEASGCRCDAEYEHECERRERYEDHGDPRRI